MRNEADHYNVWLIFAERESGHYVADLKVRIVDARGDAVVDTVVDGPWLLAQLPPGRYRVQVANVPDQPLSVGAAGRTKTVVRLAQ